MATEARAIRAGSKGPRQSRGLAASLPTGRAAQTMPAPLWPELILRTEERAVLREKLPVLQIHICPHPTPPLSGCFLSRDQTHTQILKQGELFASVLEQRRNEDLSQPLGEAEWGCQSGKTSWRKTRQSRRRRVSQTKESATKSSEQKRVSPHLETSRPALCQAPDS